MKVKTSELTGKALNWAVAQCELTAGRLTMDSEDHDSGLPYLSQGYLFGPGIVQIGTHNKATGKAWVLHGPSCGEYRPSTDWGFGGPIIEREIDMLVKQDSGLWLASVPDPKMPFVLGPAPLIAAMRCYVASKLGDEMEIPDELL